jgi:hypothetical protein
MIKTLLKLIFFIIILIGIFSISAMVVRNIYHPFFANIKGPVTFIADLPKELYREFISGKETKTPLLPASVRGLKFNIKSMPNSIIYKNKGQFYLDGNKLDYIPSDMSIFYVDQNLKFFYAQYDQEIIKYQINNNLPKEIWRLKIPYLHHERYVDDKGYIFSPNYFPNGSEMSNPAKKLYKILLKVNSPPYDKTGDNFRDDGVVVISPEGKLIHSIGLTELFSINNLLEIIYASGLETDPFHLNSVYPAKNDFGIVQKGDLLLSLRHQSMLLIYRPSTLKIIWHKVGPWTNQHSAKFNDDGKIYLFNNNVIDTHYSRRSELSFIDGKNNIMIHDIENGKTELINNCVEEKDFSTVTGGYVIMRDKYIITEYSNTNIQVICDKSHNKRLIIVPEHNTSGRVIPGTGTKIFVN